jgi:hypothetical protein
MWCSYASELLLVHSSAVLTCSSGFWAEADMAFFSLSGGQIAFSYSDVNPLSPTTNYGHFVDSGQSWEFGKHQFPKFKAIATTTGTTGFVYVTYSKQA